MEINFHLELSYRKTVYYTEMHTNFQQKTANLLKNFPDIALASVRISLPESQEYVHEEKPDYGLSRYLSDVGGAMGLVLGVSLVSFLELFECLMFGTMAGWHYRRQVRSVLIQLLFRVIQGSNILSYTDMFIKINSVSEKDTI